MSFGGGSGSGGGSISGATDVNLSNTADHEALGYDSSTAKWVNSKVALGNLGGLEQMWSNYTATGAVTLDLTNGNVFRLTLTGDVTLTFTGAVNNMVCAFTLHVKQDPGGGGHALNWPASVVWAGGTVPTVTSTAGAYDVYVFESIDGGTTWLGSVVGQDFK